MQFIGRFVFVAFLFIAGACATSPDEPETAESTQEVVTAFTTGSLIIPMDTTFQDRGTLRAFGLVYRLLRSNVPVHWAIQTGKVVGGNDFSVGAGGTVLDRETSSNVAIPVSYRGGPFVIAAADRAAALPIIDAWLASDTVTVVHDLTAGSFSADIQRSMTAAPSIAVFEDGAEDIAFRNLNAAGIPDAAGNVWSVASADVLTEAEIVGPTTTNDADGALFQNGASRYCQMTSMHYEATPLTTEIVQEVRSWLDSGPSTHAFMECHATETFETHVNGRLITTLGIVDDGATPSPLSNRAPDDPFNQFDGAIEADGGSVNSIGLAPGSVFRPGVRTLVNQTNQPLTQRIVWMSGNLDGQATNGKVTYLAGHDYTVSVPISTNPQTNGVRLFLNSLFESPCTVATFQPEITLTKSAPATIGGGTLTFTLAYANTGSGTATQVVLTDPLPTGTTFVSATGGGMLVGGNVVWNLGTLGGGAAGSVQFTVATPVDATYTNTATIRFNAGVTPKQVTSNTTTTVRNSAGTPNAVADTASTNEDMAVGIAVLANDTGLADAPISVTIAAPPANGTAVVNAGNTVTYTPNANFNGTDTFSYTVRDNNNETSTATVTVTVVPVNDSPDAIDDAVVVAEDSAATVLSVRANDLIAPDTGETLSVVAVTQPANGTVTFTAANVSFTPAANFNGMTTFTYTISDGNGGTDTATVTVTVTPVNDPPTAVDDLATVVVSSGANFIAVLANDQIAPDTGETLTVIAVTQPANGVVVFSPTGVTFTPVIGFVGTTMFTYRISDGNGGIDTATVFVTVTIDPDRDSDGLVDRLDLDDDDDGIPDRIENLLGVAPDADADNDGIANFRDRNDRGDGAPQICADVNLDNICDRLGLDFDRDGDGVANHLDLDSDNDGILDVIEVFNNLTDANTDGRLDCPGGVGTNGLCDAVETALDNGIVDWDNNNVGPDAPLASDTDNLPDFLDLDSDQDGVLDLHEGNSGCADLLPSDGRCDGPDTDGDGVVNARDGSAGHGVLTYPSRPDTDADGMPDYRDRDADGDTILDLVEANAGCVDVAAPIGACDGADADGDGVAGDASATRPDTDGDGLPDYRDLDADGDGLRDLVEGTRDTDGDALPDFRDLDSDNDGIPDVIEGSSGCADTTPRNGRCDGPDANGDGLADSATNPTPPDTDGDGALDFRDLDADNDGISDRDEGGSSCIDAAPSNVVCDGPDANRDGLADNANLVAPPNTDGDTPPDFRDLDSDDDGLPDLLEGGSNCADLDGNAVCDGPDTDVDGIADSIDGAPVFGDPTPTIPTNTDGVDQADYRDLDSDNNAMPDTEESGCTDTAPMNQRCDGPDSDGDGVVDQSDGFVGFGIGTDRDGDGVNDAIDLDDDNDGILDALEAGKDTDGDGVSDELDLDSDNDGLPDVAEAGHAGVDGNGDGQVDCPGGFGPNGFCDTLETAPESGTALVTPVDTDGDGIADFRDLDADDDGLSDRVENGTVCADVPANGVCDGDDRDRDGVVASADVSVGFGVGGYPPPPDTDGDGVPDFRDLDSDGDTIYDLDEAGFGTLDGDNDGRVDGADKELDGIKDAVDDSDLDGTVDATDPDPASFGGAGPALDTDGDGTPDFRDLDADGDGILDADEAGPEPKDPVDTDGDGKPDFQDSDADNDGLVDGVDNCRIDANQDQSDLDTDGLGDRCDPDDNNDGIEDGLGVRGGGCAAGGGGPGLALALGAILLGLRRRRVVVAAVSLWLAFAPSTAAAQVTATYPAERFQLAAHRDGLLGVEWAEVDGHLTIDAALWLGYENDPVTVYRMADGERVGALVHNRYGGELVASIRIKSRLELNFGAPLIVAQSDELGGLMTTPPGDLSGFGFGDLRLIPKLMLVRQGSSPVSVAILASVTLPTSTTDDYGGDNGATISPALVVSRGQALGARASFSAGYRARKPSRALDLMVDDEVFGAAGIGYRFKSSLELDATFDYAAAAADVTGSFGGSHAEIRGGAGIDATDRVRLFSAGGVGIAQGFSTPDWRFLVGVRVASRRDEPAPVPVRKVVDTDGDGILDPDDSCPTVAENINDFEDQDGCPDDPDPDKDGILSAADACPSDPEDADAFQDTDGCPDPDNDQDQVLDIDDACRDVPGVVAMKGCPDPDRDGDTVVDRLDNCPDEPGLVEQQGCKKKQLVKIGEGKLEILDIVYFALNKALIEKRSYRLLDDVANVLVAHPEIVRIQIEGHTDSQGNDVYNKKLSQARAEAVRTYLIKKKVAAERLEAFGFGEDRPIADNATKEGRAVNRRVEFLLVGGSAIDVNPTGPGADTMERE